MKAAGIVLVALAGAGLVAVTAGPAVGNEVLGLDCSLRSARPSPPGWGSAVYAADGSLLDTASAQTQRLPLPLPAISPWLRKATVAIEDRRFWQEGGVDYRGILRAALADITAGRIVEGGSTITQQLVRALYLRSDPRTFGRKLEEACLAVKLAERRPKSQVLDAYLNDVYYGNAAYGAAAAARAYFDEPARRLTLDQAALIAGLPQAPSAYDPFLQPALALARRGEVLRALAATGQIHGRTYRAALAAPLGLRPGRIASPHRHPAFVGYVEQQLAGRFGAGLLADGGLDVHTTLDPRLQDAARSAMTGVLAQPRDPAAALVAIDPRTGGVRALADVVPGSNGLDFNLATQARRQAGSSFKPMVLATALEQGIPLGTGFAGPAALTVADPRCDSGVQPWTVHNYAGEEFPWADMQQATADSINTVFAQLVVKVGPQNVVRTAHSLGITTPLQPFCSIALGSQPVTPLEMASAYATLADGGVYRAPRTVAWVSAPSGRVLWRPQTRGRRELAPSVARSVTSALETVIQSGTGKAASLGRPAAGKTGTADNYTDAWFCGYVPQLAACVWVGYPGAEVPMVNVEGLPAVFGGSLPAEIWQRFMSAALAPVPVEPFPGSPSG